ncbi:WD40 repeat domain-containing protein [Chloropicon primus]|uniref:WD40 repeat domain-containing protein n=2 Tax=Chloropicon primus TaxID=1764295 RepID=A0A5B8MDZ7_9CHLO|nr:WD40 repeat domain-containing protein [Chloropicon primus]|eukprot:QDZ17522.1 WD40 repeat domain-containing protein [Chloropicon primus]
MAVASRQDFLSADEDFSDDGSRATSSYREVPLPENFRVDSLNLEDEEGDAAGGATSAPSAEKEAPASLASETREVSEESSSVAGAKKLAELDVAVSEAKKNVVAEEEEGRVSKSPQTTLQDGKESMKVRDAGTGKEYVLEKVYRIKDLDTGTEFIVDAEQTSDKDAQAMVQVDTGEELSMAQFEKNIGLRSPLMREMTRRDKDSGDGGPPKLIYSSDDEGEAIRKNRGGLPKKKWFQKSLNTLKSKALNAGDALAETFRPKDAKGEGESASGVGESASQNQEDEFWTPGGKTGKQVKVNVHKKIYKEFTDLRITQELVAHKGAVWSMKFSVDGMYLATAGQDEIVRIWQVKEGAKSENAKSEDKKNSFFHSKPYRLYGGHKADILDLCWSKTQFLLSSSMDKTVRLWHISMNECLRVFSHTDFVTSIQFHPIDDKYFLSGSLDEKVRLWSIPEQTVIDWVNIHEMVTAVCFSPDGKKAVIGSYKGKCRFYSVEGNQFEYITQMDVKNTRGKNSRGKKITGLQYMPGVDRFLLVTSNDSRIRMYDGFTLCCKYKGHRNANSQIASGFSPGGGFVACGSEDGSVCIWSTINTFIPSVNPFYTGYRSDKNASFESFLASDDIVTSAVFAPHHDNVTISGNLGIAPPTKAAEALVKPSLKRLGLGKTKADQEREDAQRAGETAMRAAAAVGQTIVTSGFSGEIRVFENVGLPIWL